MTATNLHHETGTTIEEWQSALSLLVTTCLYESRGGFRERQGKENRALVRQAIDALLAHLALALVRGRPEVFADYLSDDDALAAGADPDAVDLATTLEQMRNTLRRYLPGPRGELVCEYIGFALARLAQLPFQRVANAMSPVSPAMVTMR